MLISNFSNKGDIFELNPQLRAIKEFDELSTDRRMRFVALVADYETPFKQKKGKVRREAVAKELKFPLEKDGKRLDKNGRVVVDGKDPKIEAAIKKYRSLMFDLQKESIEAIETQITQMIELMKAPKPADDDKVIGQSIDLAEKTAKFGKTIVELKKQRQELIDTMGAPDENEEDHSPKTKLTEVEGSHLNDLEKYNLEHGNR